MGKNISHKVGKGITPEAFIRQMEKNQDIFLSNYKNFSMDEKDLTLLKNLCNDKDIRCEIIAADWCGDVARNVPVIFRLMEVVNIPAEVFILEENFDLIDQFLTLGGRSVPVVLFTNRNGDVLAQWGPRPAYIQEPMVEFKHLQLDPNSEEYKNKVKDVYTEIMRRYGEGTEHHQLIIDEIRDILAQIN
ncbi:thioredoxin family protein [Scopulibacillus cellulosilyticus]|uniref:Thioredoxin family protein n=1 Tax=Scopulibacillus cellulosilyticus TaxID=2665665 RepID=A0ABW2PZY8_9BACL